MSSQIEIVSCFNVNSRLRKGLHKKAHDTKQRIQYSVGQGLNPEFKVPMQRNFTQRFLDCIAKII